MYRTLNRYYQSLATEGIMTAESNSDLVEELAHLASGVSELSGAELITCHPSMVQVSIRLTQYKHVVVCTQFSDDYPNTRLLVELKSKTIPQAFLQSLVNVCDQELQKHIGKHQILSLIKFVYDFVSSNPFIVCSDELNYIKKELHREKDELKVKQKAGTLFYKACEGKYFMEFKLTIPDEYPSTPVILDIKDSAFPPDLTQVFVGHAAEICRQCVQPPITGDLPFQPKPSLQVTADYLVRKCTRRYPQEKCPVCKEGALPEDPKDIISNGSHPKYVYRVYCGHVYHCSCLDTYMKTPPFAGGKKCPSCNQRLFHDKWNLSQRLVEDRWAHQEARKREIAEVADFLGF